MRPTITDVERHKAKVRRMAAGRALAGDRPYRLVFTQLSLYLLVETGDRR